MHSAAVMLAFAAPALAAARIDWRETGCVGAVQDQGHLATVDVVPTVEAVECAVYNATGQLIRLSTQQIIDCAPDLTKFGEAFAYVHAKGLETAAAYPSSSDADRPKCIYDEALVVVALNTVGGSASGATKEKDLANALHFAPVAAAFTVGTEFELYNGGVIAECGTGGLHVMEIVGYTDPNPDQQNTSYWIVKNTWGANWGEAGYAYIAKDQGACGLKDPTCVSHSFDCLAMHACDAPFTTASCSHSTSKTHSTTTTTAAKTCLLAHKHTGPGRSPPCESVNAALPCLCEIDLLLAF